MQTHYVEKFLTKFNCSDYSPVNIPIDPIMKLMSNKGNTI